MPPLSSYTLLVVAVLMGLPIMVSADQEAMVVALLDDDSIVNAVDLFFSNQQQAEQQYGPIGDWDTSQVTDMSLLFVNRPDFNSDISAWDVSSVTTMARMFSGASSFNADISAWDVSQVVTLDGLLENADSFDQDLSSWQLVNAAALDSCCVPVASSVQVVCCLRNDNVCEDICSVDDSPAETLVPQDEPSMSTTTSTSNNSSTTDTPIASSNTTSAETTSSNPNNATMKDTTSNKNNDAREPTFWEQAVWLQVVIFLACFAVLSILVIHGPPLFWKVFGCSDESSK